MGEFIKKYQLVLTLAAIVVFMSVVKMTYKYDPATDTRLVPTPTVTTVIKPTITEPLVSPSEATGGGQRTYESDYPLWALLPYSGKGFEVDRYLAPRKLAAKARGLDKKIAQEEIFKWMEANDIDPTTHEIEFIN